MERPILLMGSGTHFAVIEDGEMGTVENDDYVAALVRFAPDSRAAGAAGTLEASRIIVGPQCGLGFEIYGTDGSATWNFEQMNELRARIIVAARSTGTPPCSATPTSATTRSSSPVCRWATTT